MKDTVHCTRRDPSVLPNMHAPNNVPKAEGESESCT